MPIWVPSSAPSFNAGVMVIDMRLWVKLNVTSAVLTWARENKHRRLWRLQSHQLPLIYIYITYHIVT